MAEQDRRGRYRSGITPRKQILTNNGLYWAKVKDVRSVRGLYDPDFVKFYPSWHIGAAQPDTQEPTREMIPTIAGGTQYMRMRTIIGSIARFFTFEVTTPPGSLGGLRSLLGRFLRNANQCRVDGYHILDCVTYEDSTVIHFPDSLYSFLTLGELTNTDDAGTSVRNTTSFETPAIFMTFGLDAQKRFQASNQVWGAFPLSSDDCGCTQGCQDVVFLARDSAVETALSGYYITDDGLRTVPTFVNLFADIGTGLPTDLVEDAGTFYIAVETHPDGPIVYPLATGVGGELWSIPRSGGTATQITLPETNPSAKFLFIDNDNQAIVVGHGVNATSDGYPSVYRGPDFANLAVINEQNFSVGAEDLIVTDAAFDSFTNTVYVVARTETTDASRLIAIQNNAVSNITSQVPTLAAGEYLTAVAVVGPDEVVLGTSNGRILDANFVSENNDFYLYVTPLVAEAVQKIVGSFDRHIAVTDTRVFERSPNTSFEWREFENLPNFGADDPLFGPRGVVGCDSFANEFDGPNDYWLVTLDGSFVKLQNK